MMVNNGFGNNVQQVVLLWPQIPFGHPGAKSLLASKAGIILATRIIIMIGNMERRTYLCKVRLRKEEYELFKKKASGYQTMSGMIRDAVRQFNDVGTVKRIEALNDMTGLYRKYQQDLSWLGGNFNQAMKRANELAIGESLDQRYYEQVIIPQSKRVLLFLEKLKSEQTKIAKKLIRL